MKILNINKEQLNNFVSEQKCSQFLQSWEWGEFQESAGNKVIRLGVEENGKIILAASLIKKELPLGLNYFYLPRVGIGNQSKEAVNFLFEEIKKIAPKENVIFLRFEPIDDLTPALLPAYRQAGFVKRGGFSAKRVKDVQPSKTLMVDLTKNQDKLLKEMHTKTRYNIRLAEKKGVRIAGSDISHFDIFWKLMSETEDRDQFRLHSQDYYRKMLAQGGLIKIFMAELNSKPIVTGIFAFFGDTVTYVHGASSNQNRNVMAPYLLQWRIIKLSQELGYKSYDFHGIDEAKWPGVTRFKKGFGGEVVEYPGTYDIAFDKVWYNVYILIRKIRRIF